MAVRRILEQTSQIRLGDHLVVLYEREEDVKDCLTAYIQASLLRNERCIYITGDVDSSLVLQQIRDLNIENIGDLVILDNKDAYSSAGTFNPNRMITLLKSFANTAILEGYSGLAITGEISWLLKYEKGQALMIEYEWKLNEQIFNHYPVSALCRYNLTKFSNEMIINIIQLHPYLIWNKKIHENPFYIPVEGYKNNEVPKYQVKAWLENIHCFTDEKSRFKEAISKKEKEMQKLHQTMTDGIIMSLIELLSVHDTYTNNHSKNVAQLAKTFAEYISLPDKTVATIYYAGLLHDIGKTLIPKDILNKHSALTDKENSIMKMHPVYGAQALYHIDRLREIANSVRCHHEQWDGEGYPDGLARENIPQLARILSLADTYDAMTNDRPYRKAFSHNVALSEILVNAGKQFDPLLAQRFVSMLREKKGADDGQKHGTSR